MKVDKKYNLMIVNSTLCLGGAEIVIRNLCCFLGKNLFNINICLLKEKGEIADELCKKGYDIKVIPKSNIFKVNYFSFLRLLMIIIKKKINIIHTHDTASLVDSALCKLFFPHIKLVHTFHFGNYPNVSKSRMHLEKIFWRMTNKLIAVGNMQKKQVQTAFNIPDYRIKTIWNGISMPNKEINHQRDGNNIIIGTIGTLYKQKGITYLIDVAAELKRKGYNLKFLVVGEGPLRDELTNKCSRLGLADVVQFTGWIKDVDIKVMPEIDIIFQPSLWEAMSVVIIEAMATGKPIVATDVGENRYMIDDGENGFIVRPKDISNMVSSLESLINNADLRLLFGKKARMKYEAFMTAEIMARNYEKLYVDVLTS